ncbi:MAG TPA: hypothetical protein VJY33_03895 [Isosphaeraceae bacterium]|nr:hypothetical protein [Isosphaeraceae bacterium]
MLDPDGPSSSFQVAERAWPQTDMPFTFDGVPIALKAKARRIPEWQLDRFGLVATLQDSPVKSDQPTETVTLIPMGAARLRISAFPAIGNGPDAHTWADTAAPKPLFHVSASHCNDLRGSTQARMVSRSGSDRGDDSLRVRGIEVEAPQERQDFVTLRGENLVVMDCHERNHVSADNPPLPLEGMSHVSNSVRTQPDPRLAATAREIRAQDADQPSMN